MNRSARGRRCVFRFESGNNPFKASLLVGIFLLTSWITVLAVWTKEGEMADANGILQRIYGHVAYLTEDIGERSILFPENLTRTRDYILRAYEGMHVPAQLQHYDCSGMDVANVIGRIVFREYPSLHYVVGAHYDSVEGTVGADDNASAIAVQLELARSLKTLQSTADLNLTVTLVSFALEEPPIFMTPGMGSRVYVADARSRGEKIDGMICLEMVGYTCREAGCQSYPFPLMFMNYPKEGNFIGIVGNYGSRTLTRSLFQAFQKNASLPAVPLTIPFNGWLMPAVRLSDHASFWDNGYKAVMITDSAFYRNPYYHTRADTMEKLDYQFMSEVVKSLMLFFMSHGE